MSLLSFLETTEVEYCKETHRRIRLSVAAYAYEFESDPIMSDGDFDEMCSKVDLSVNTSRPDMDKWFRENFDKSTGQGIHTHPELNRIQQLYEKHYRSRV